jgi:D-alanyl-D-alanine carboxypeptidase
MSARFVKLPAALAIVAALSLLVAAPSFASAGKASDAKKVTRAVHALFNKLPLRSTLYGVWVKGRPLVRGALGQAKPGIPATLDDHFRIGNVTEAMTVTVLLQLVEEGRLSLDDPISTWFPDYPRAGEITVDMLARSTSGYAHYGADPAFAKAVFKDPHRRWKIPEVLSFAFNLPPLFDPGASWAFSDTNFLILGQVLRRVTGEPVEQLLRERIWSELEMKETQLRNGGRFPAPVLHGFTDQRGGYEDATSWTATTFRGAGTGVSTLDDVGKWTRALGTGALLSPASHALQIGDRNVGLDDQTEAFHYAMGSGVSNGWIYNNPRLNGYKGLAAYLPAKQIAVVVEVVDGPGGADAKRFNHAIANRIGELVVPEQPPNLGP